MVGLLMGALGTGVGQAAGAAADMAKGYIDDERKVDLQRQFADIELEKQNRLDEARKAREYEYKVKEKDPNGDLVRNELATSNLEAVQTAKNKVDQVNSPGYLEAKRKEAQSTHIESAGSAAQAELSRVQADSARIKNENEREVAALRKEAAKPDTSPARKEEIKNTIEILTGKDSDNYGHYTDQETGKTVIYNKKDGKTTSSVGGAPAGPWSKYGQ